MVKFKTKINLEQLRFEIQHLNNRKNLYYVLKEELDKLGYWKQLQRGKPNVKFVKR